jgi:hypothetical protein
MEDNRWGKAKIEKFFLCVKDLELYSEIYKRYWKIDSVDIVAKFEFININMAASRRMDWRVSDWRQRQLWPQKSYFVSLSNWT